MAIVCLNGRYLGEKEATISVADAGLLYGEGIYETMRTGGGEVMYLDKHLARLQRSADLLEISLPPLKKIATWVRGTVKRNGFWENGNESRIRLTVSGGVHGFGEPSKKATIVVSEMPLQEVGSRCRMKGVSVITVPIERPFPEAKTTFLVPAMVAQRAMKKARAYEALLLDRKGRVTEGAISNVFVVKRGRLITPKSWILGGTTRARIIELARQHKWKLKQKDFGLKTLYSADEVFICNAPRGIVPVVKVDGKKVGKGKVGPVTLRTWEALKNMAK